MRGEFWVDARRAEEEEFRGVVAIGSVDDVGLEGEVVVNEIGGVGGIGEDATNFGSGQENILGLLFCKEGEDCF